MKEARQKRILELIDNHDIQTQEELIARLEQGGYRVTQATVSRDIRELGLIKGVNASGVYRYILPVRPRNGAPKLNSALNSSIVSIDCAGNLLVIKTYPGLANAVAACIDSLHIPELLGCVAGDDTILAVLQSENGAKNCENKLRSVAEHL